MDKREIENKIQARINFYKWRQEKDGEFARIYADQEQKFLEEILKDLERIKNG